MPPTNSDAACFWCPFRDLFRTSILYVFWSPLAAFWLPFASFGRLFGSPWLPFGTLWPTLGSFFRSWALLFVDFRTKFALKSCFYALTIKKDLILNEFHSFIFQNCKAPADYCMYPYPCKAHALQTTFCICCCWFIVFVYLKVTFSGALRGNGLFLAHVCMMFHAFYMQFSGMISAWIFL